MSSHIQCEHIFFVVVVVVVAINVSKIVKSVHRFVQKVQTNEPQKGSEHTNCKNQ